VDLIARLENQVTDWALAGFPALLERFCLRHGQYFQGVKRPKGVRKMQAKMCFRNSTRGLHENDMKYFEGYAMHREIEFPFLHAWNVKGGKVVDLTLPEPEKYEYIGLDLTKYVNSELLKNQVYGLLDPGVINLELLRKIDGRLVDEGLSVRAVHSGRPKQSHQGK
jgi:hypothetical protein